MVVKLPRDRVDELIMQGIGRPFAPAGKVSRERCGSLARANNRVPSSKNPNRRPRSLPKPNHLLSRTGPVHT
jgi:hypothetical protein